MLIASTPLAFLFASLALAQGPAPMPAPSGETPAPSWPRYATGGSGSIYGLPDPGAPVLRELKAGEPLVVVGQKGALLEVEVPSGLSAWIYASYVRDGKEPGTVETIESDVNVRPEPRTDTRALPIARARKGQTFAVVGRQNDWVNVVVPAEVHGYVASASVTVTGDSPAAHATEIGAASRWIEEARAEAVAKEKVRRADEEKRRAEEDKRREAERKDQGARQLCADAMVLLRGAPSATDRDRASKMLADAAATSTSEAVAADVKRGRERIDNLAFYERESTAEAERRERERAEARLAAEDAAKKLEDIRARQKDPQPIDAFGARFTSMGWLQRGLELTRGRTYSIQKGGRLLAYVSCPTGKYQLDDFVGREIGVIGSEKQVEGFPASVIEVERIEVLAP